MGIHIYFQSDQSFCNNLPNIIQEICGHVTDLACCVYNLIVLNRCVNFPNKHWHFKYKSIKLRSLARLFSNSS